VTSLPCRLKVVVFLLATAALAAAAAQFGPARYGRVELDVQSEFSHIRLRKSDSVRTLLFVRDSGEEVVESGVDLDRPHELLVEYTRFMFLSYVHRPQPRRVLIVGLGGGSMVHFLKHYDPQVAVDVVEIDPAIISIADKYFGIRSEGNVKIIQADGLKYLTETDARYDVIYMDAFLKPSPSTDVSGVPLALKTVEFYQQVQEKLVPGGIVVFNLNPHAGTRSDVATIGQAFRQTYTYRLPVGGLVVVATTSGERLTRAAILRQAAALDRRFQTSFQFERLARELQR
jgi:spermidine synthase